MRALITGANGFAGRYLCEHLISCGDQVFGAAFDTESDLPARVTRIALDVRDASAVRKAIADARPDAVYHLAAISAVATVKANPRLAYETNVAGTFNVIEAVAGCASDARVLNVSTAQVYATDGETITEETPVRPANAYASTKAMAEFAARMFPDTHVITARPFNHSGPGQTTDFVLSSFAAQVVEIERGLRAPVLEVGDIDVERDFLDVRDVVRAYRLLVERGSRSEIYNVASGNAISLSAVLEMIRRSTAETFEVKVVAARRRPGQARRLAGNYDKLHAATGWTPAVPIEKTVGDLLHHWRTINEQVRSAAKS